MIRKGFETLLCGLLLLPFWAAASFGASGQTSPDLSIEIPQMIDFGGEYNVTGFKSVRFQVQSNTLDGPWWCFQHPYSDYFKSTSYFVAKNISEKSIQTVGPVLTIKNFFPQMEVLTEYLKNNTSTRCSISSTAFLMLEVFLQGIESPYKVAMSFQFMGDKIYVQQVNGSPWGDFFEYGSPLVIRSVNPVFYDKSYWDSAWNALDPAIKQIKNNL